MRKIITASSALALLGFATAFSPAANAQGAEEICNPVLDSTGDPVIATLGGDVVIHNGSFPCPPQAEPVTAAPAPAPAPSLADSVYFVFFDFDRANITPAAQDIVNTVVTDYRSNQAQGVNVVGHTDTSGPAAYNQRLSERRATAVREALVRSGVPGDTVDTSGVGETQPLIATGDGVREPSNRRAEIRFR
ncbi:MAG TPA: OmpA family protein [Arenibaculum sp.]|nr:OmpA family protein [Arenibaculum sp.]